MPAGGQRHLVESPSIEQASFIGAPEKYNQKTNVMAGESLCYIVGRDAEHEIAAPNL